jgi:hypothetical protein
MDPVINPKFEHLCQQCECLGQATINDVTADLFICAETVIARFGDRPDDYLATHISHLNAFSDVFLLAAFRLHLDAQGLKPEYTPAIHAVPPLKADPITG